MNIEIRKLPKKIRNMNKEELINYISKKIKLEYDFLYKLELEEIQYLFIKIRKYGGELVAGGFLIGHNF